MLKYVKDALIQFNHAVPPPPTGPTSPTHQTKIGQKIQYTEQEDTYLPLTAANKNILHEVLGVSLYYGRAFDSTILVALGTLATQQAAPTEITLRNVNHFLDYAASHPGASITFNARDMFLAGHS